MSNSQTDLQRGRFEGEVLTSLEMLAEKQELQWKVIEEIKEKVNKINITLATSRGIIYALSAVISSVVAIIVTVIKGRIN